MQNVKVGGCFETKHLCIKLTSLCALSDGFAFRKDCYDKTIFYFCRLCDFEFPLHVTDDDTILNIKTLLAYSTYEICTHFEDEIVPVH